LVGLGRPPFRHYLGHCDGMGTSPCGCDRPPHIEKAPTQRRLWFARLCLLGHVG
jgi:hypothetical protein